MNNTRENSNTYSYVLLAIAFAVLAWWSYSHLEYRFEEVDKGYQGEARTNSLLAAEYFLLRMGQPAEKINLFAPDQKSLQEDDTLLVSSNRISFDQRRSSQLLDWVKQGGHLIITGKNYSRDDYISRDHILDALGLFIEWKISKDKPFEDDLPIDIDVLDDENFWQVNFVDYLVISLRDDKQWSELDSEIIWKIEDQDRVHGLQLRVGQGRLTVLSDLRMFHNDYIDHYDHAAFLYALSQHSADASGTGVFYYSLYEDHVSLYQWLWQYASPLMISLILLVIIVLWMIIPRFGPIIHVQQPVRQRFQEHLSAAGNYHWRQGHYSYLLGEVRRQLSQQLKLKHPEWQAVSRQDQLAHLAELSGLESPLIESALFDSTVERANDFINKIKILEKLRKCL